MRLFSDTCDCEDETLSTPAVQIGNPPPAFSEANLRTGSFFPILPDLMAQGNLVQFLFRSVELETRIESTYS